ncbi:MAG: hypothetical protein OXE52_02770 [Chloroflexi bacterium]|nr:hypothetical protein [Chloroflexota bacterium]
MAIDAQPEDKSAIQRSETHTLNVQEQRIADAIIAALDPRLGVIESDVKSLRGDLGSLRGEFGSLREDLGSLRGELGSLREELGSLREEFGSLRGELGSLREEFGSLRGELGSLRGEFGSLREEFDVSNEIWREMHSDVDDLLQSQNMIIDALREAGISVHQAANVRQTK